ncbi:hypothetical protein EHV15_00815 [Paenibacillus oralis]|uniref:Uncharacterized protein n=1 Tax=Paenibacillus oralis TaxID=2490856 RepID=A0A3P3TU58_9BACL|nr:DUF5381 family protein [Paenibacillus oralis]RRJ61675.1 hypothetical protein EHV15_00815 [Paenibacillus oralis]
MKTISYRKSVAWGKTLGSLLFVLTCLFLLYAALFMDVSPVRLFFCITSAIIGLPFFGGYFAACFPRALRFNPRLLTYDQRTISDGTNTVAWAEISGISYNGPSIRQWLLPQFPELVFHLKNKETWTVSTYYLLTDAEIHAVMKLLRGLISRNGKE